MVTYCTDDDLLKYRPNIMDLGVDDWSEQRAEAYRLINRVITARWYRTAAPEMGFDPRVTVFDSTKVRADTFKALEAFKTLELAYTTLKKDGHEEDGFERAEKSFRKKYNEELELILAAGIDYDWDDSGTMLETELYLRTPRRLVRN